MSPPERSHHLKALVSGAGYAVLNLFLGIGVGLILSPYVVRSVGDRDYGIMLFAGTLTGWYALLDLGLTSAVGRFVTLHHAKQDFAGCVRVANTSFFIYVLIGLTGLVTSLAVAAFADLIYQDAETVGLFSLLIIITGATFLVDIPMRALNGVVNGVMRGDLTALRGIVFRLLGAAQTVAILHYGGGVVALTLGQLILACVNWVVMYRLATRSLPGFNVRLRHFERAELGVLFNYSIYTFIAQIGDVLIFKTDALIVGSMVSFAAVTHYTLGAATLVSYFQSLMLAMTSWLTTWLTHLDARNDRSRILTTMASAYKLSTYLASFIAFGLIAWGPAFLTRWIGPEYLDAYPSLVALTLYMWALQSQSPSGRFLYAVSKHRYYAVVNVSEAVANFVLSLILVRYLGMFGVALGTLIPGVLGRGVAIPLAVCRALDIRAIDYYRMFSLHVATATACLVLPAGITYWLIAPEYPRLLLVGGLCAAVYAASIMLVGLGHEERARILGLMRRRAAPVAQ